MEYLEERPIELQQEIFQKLFTAAKVAAMNKEEFKEYQATMKTERDINSIKWTAEKRGMEQGLKEGMEKQSLIIAKNFKSYGIPCEVIAQNTGLSIEEVEAL